MDILKFARIINSESDAIKFLAQCLRDHHLRKSIQCPSCKIQKTLHNEQRICKMLKCLADYEPFSNTQFGMLRISYTKWLTIIKLFDLGISARRAAREADPRYPTTLKAFDVIRYSILYQLAKSDKVLNGEIEADSVLLHDAYGSHLLLPSNVFLMRHFVSSPMSLLSLSFSAARLPSLCLLVRLSVERAALLPSMNLWRHE